MKAEVNEIVRKDTEAAGCELKEGIYVSKKLDDR